MEAVILMWTELYKTASNTILAPNKSRGSCKFSFTVLCSTIPVTREGQILPWIIISVPNYFNLG